MRSICLSFKLFLSLPFFTEAQNETYQIINNIDDAIILDSTIFSVNTASDSTIIYEIADYKGLSGQAYSALIIKKRGKNLIEWLELKKDDLEDLELIDIKRAQWMKTCNQHKTEDLVRNFYAPDALYYNHKPMVQGTSAIIQEYGYMNDPNYSLRLMPLIVKHVNHYVIYEIGKCEGSYNGNYILIWKKNTEGDWMIAFDSNI